MAQAALDEEFNRIARLVWARSSELSELDVVRWMKRIDQLESNGVISEGVAYDLRSSGFFWRERFDEALNASRLALQRLPRETKERVCALTNFATAATAVGDSKAAIDACIEALGSPFAPKAHVAGILVGELSRIGFTDDAAAIADEYLSDAALSDGPTSINAAVGLAFLGRHHQAVEQLARYVASITDKPRGDRTALEVLADQHDHVRAIIALAPTLLDAWRYVEAYEAAKLTIGRDGEHRDDAAGGEIPDWVHALRARAAREVLPESEA
jgi:hypothetical protein